MGGALKIVAKRQVGNSFLILTKDGRKAFVADFDEKKRFPFFDFQSILSRGYWFPVEHSVELLKKIEKLPRLQRN